MTRNQLNLFSIIAGTFMVLATIIISVPKATADGGGCTDATQGSITGSGSLVTFTTPSGQTITDVCIKSGSRTFGPNVGDQHSGKLGNGDAGLLDCYNVSGVGTSSVTVTKRQGPACKDISHIDVYYNNTTPTPSPSPSVTPSPSPSVTPSPSPTPTVTPTPTPSVTPSPSPTPSVTPSPSPSVTPTPSPTPTPTPQVTPSPTPEPDDCEQREDCEEEPTPTPSASPTPKPSSPKASLGTNTNCSNEVSATYDAFDENGNPIQNLEVTFKYGPHTKKATTNSEGRARVTFTSSGEINVYADANGFSQLSEKVNSPECESSDTEGEVLGTSTDARGGAVLGASTEPLTYAATGNFEDRLFAALAVIGSFCITAAALIYDKK